MHKIAYNGNISKAAGWPRKGQGMNMGIDHYSDQLVEAWLEGKWGEVVRDIRGRGREGIPDTERSAALAVAVFEKLNRRLGQGNVQACEFFQRVTAVPGHTEANAWAEVDPPLAPCGLKSQAECKQCYELNYLGEGPCTHLEAYQDEPDEDEPEQARTWHRVDGQVNQDGSVSVHVSTNDNLDKGWPSEQAEWDSSCRSVLAFLKQYGTSRVGCVGCEVTVTLNGTRLHEFLPKCPKCGAEAYKAAIHSMGLEVFYDCKGQLIQGVRSQETGNRCWMMQCRAKVGA